MKTTIAILLLCLLVCAYLRSQPLDTRHAIDPAVRRAETNTNMNWMSLPGPYPTPYDANEKDRALYIKGFRDGYISSEMPWGPWNVFHTNPPPHDVFVLEQGIVAGRKVGHQARETYVSVFEEQMQKKSP